MKTGIYFAHYECFGHTSRVVAISEIIKKRFPRGNLFFIQAGVQQLFSKIDEVGKVYSLPEAFMGRQSFKQPIPAGNRSIVRAKACRNILTQQNPDFLITEFFPLGREECRHELMPSLVKVSQQKTVIWSIAGYPLLMGADHEWREKILKLYKKIIILAPSVEKDIIAGSFSYIRHRQNYLDFFKRHAQKIVFAGYLLPQQEVVYDDKGKNAIRPSIPRNVCHVAVVRGGGAYYPKIIAEAIQVSDLLGKEYYFTIVAGPSTSSLEWEFFNTLMSKKSIKNAVLFRSIGDYQELIKKCDVCVSTASYHTSVMILKHRKRAVVIPFKGLGLQSHHEQPARSKLLQETLSAEILPFKELTSKDLASAIIKKAGERVSSSIPKKWFMGDTVLEEQLADLRRR